MSIFLLPKGLKLQDPEDKSTDWIFVVKVAATIFLGAAIAAVFAAFFHGGNFVRDLTDAELAIDIILDAAECLYFGVGVAFAVFVGIMLPNINEKLKVQIIAVYIGVCWLFLSWFPHGKLHRYLHDLWSIIALDITFHWSVFISGAFMTKFVYTFLVQVSKRKFRRADSWKEFYKSDTFQIVFLIVVGAIFMFVIGFAQTGIFTPALKPTSVQVPILLVIDIVESCFFGLAVAFAVKMSQFVWHIHMREVRYKAFPLIMSISWILGSWPWHGKTHLTLSDEEGRYIPWEYILVEIFFHWTVMIASIVISYNIFGLIRMVYFYSTSPWRRVEADSSVEMSKDVSGETTVGATVESSSDSVVEE